MKDINIDVIKKWVTVNQNWLFPTTLIASCFETIMLLLLIVAGMPFWAFLSIHCVIGIIFGLGWLMENNV